MTPGGYHRGRGAWLAAAAACAFGTASGPTQARGSAHFDAVVQLNGTPAGAYLEETRTSQGRLIDKVELALVLNRLGARVAIEETDTYEQDDNGRLLGGHSESSSSKDAVATDFAVKDGTLVLTSHTGGKAYVRSVPVQGSLIGPEGVRRLMRQARDGSGSASFQTFMPALGGLAKGSLAYQGAETIKVGGRDVRAFRYRETFEGQPGAATLWVDQDGYTVRASQDTPFGPVDYVRGKPDLTVLAAGANLPAEVYERSIAVSNIRLPHPRLVDALTLEITKKPGAEDGWPDFASAGQRVVSQTPRRVLLEVSRAGQPGALDQTPPTPDDLDANALIQTDLPDVKRIAREVTSGEPDPWKAALKLQAWTNAHMTFDAGIAVAPASELIRDRHGTCLGYSILLATLARASGIPARIRMGYVYLADMWGGHAWVEVHAGGRWLPLDSAIYYPGAADPARLGAVTETGAGGTLSGVGELAKLYGKVEIHILGYRRAGTQTPVKADDADHAVSGDVYRNPWLGLVVTKPAEASFADLDSHWPSDLVLTMNGPSGQVAIHQDRAEPGAALASEVSDLFEQAPGGARPRLEPAVWNGAPAVRLEVGKLSGIAAKKDDQLWIVTASGPDRRALLDRALAGIAIDDLKP
jgi:hypothetical protein